MRRGLSLVAAAIVAMAFGGCANSDDAVRSKEQALAIAKAEWGDTLVRDRALRVARYESDWIVTREWRAGDSSEESILVDAKSGLVSRSSVQTGTLVLDHK